MLREMEVRVTREMRNAQTMVQRMQRIKRVTLLMGGRFERMKLWEVEVGRRRKMLREKLLLGYSSM